MKWHDINIQIVFSVILIGLLSCKNDGNKSQQFSGDEQVTKMAEDMFQAIGGKQAWCNLRSLYIKAEHTEPQMTIPYQSEIWRGIDTFELVIEQQNDSFHVKAVVNEKKGIIHYLDDRDTFRLLSEEQLNDWKFGHQHNIYVLLHNLACHPEEYHVELDEDNKLAFYRDSIFVTSFGLDDANRPHLFYSPNPDGSVSGSMFSHWGTDNGLVHSAGGHPLDSNFIYRTQVWTPSDKSLRQQFGEEIFAIQQ